MSSIRLIPLVTLLVLAAASFRVTRFIVIDDLISTPREAIRSWFLNKGRKIGFKLYDLIGCTWCVGMYISASIYWIYLQDFEISWEASLNILAIAGVQGLLHAFEPSDNE